MFAGVYIIDSPYNLDKMYDYYVSDEILNGGGFGPGCFVVVPFGGGNKKRTAVVWTVKDTSEVEMTKPVAEALYNGFALTVKQMELAEYIKDAAFCTIGDAIRAILPAGLRQDIFFTYRINKDKDITSEVGSLSDKAVIILSLISEKPRSLKELETEYGADIKRFLKVLTEGGYITEETNYNSVVSEKTEKFVVFNREYSDFSVLQEKVKNVTAQGLSVVEYLQDNGDSSLDDITGYLMISASAVKTLEKKGVVEIIDRKVESTESLLGGNEDFRVGTDFELSESQRDAYERLLYLYNLRRPCAALLHGITGSGKTHVLLKLIGDVIADGKSVIYLVPEISLTPQVYKYLKDIYGELVGILHSSLAKTEKVNVWNSVINGGKKIVIGARSAIFAPFDDLGLVIIDEEHDHTYKSEQKPYYHARDVARFKCSQSGAMMVLASATPLVESYYKAVSGKYELIKIKERYGESVLPEIILSDMREDDAENQLMFIGDRLKYEIERNLARKEQVILYQNRRGYNNFLSCRSCGEVVMCPKCSIALKLHADEKYKNDRGRRIPTKLVCHYCGYTIPMPDKCPSCESEHLLALGSGTQKCEDDVEEMFPGAKVIRMDADATAKKNSHEEIIRRVKDNDIDILVGTQMVTKGHNFNNVTLVGVLNADQTLYLEDYRAHEKTFSMITQVAGRAGRAEKNGRAVIQTWNGKNEVLKLCVENDYETLYAKEIRLRKACIFPPFCDICALYLSSMEEAQVLIAANKLKEEINRLLGTEYKEIAFEVYGPFQAVVYKINNNYKIRFIIKCVLNKKTRSMLSVLLKTFTAKLPKKINIYIDVNPNTI